MDKTNEAKPKKKGFFSVLKESMAKRSELARVKVYSPLKMAFIASMGGVSWKLEMP